MMMDLPSLVGLRLYKRLWEHEIYEAALNDLFTPSTRRCSAAASASENPIKIF
jgi:hypothetical protein